MPWLHFISFSFFLHNVLSKYVFFLLYCRGQLEASFSEGIIQALPVLLRPAISNNSKPGQSPSGKANPNGDILHSTHLVTTAGGSAAAAEIPPASNFSHTAATENRLDEQLCDSVEFSKSTKTCPTCQRAYTPHHQQKQVKRNPHNKTRKKSTSTSSSMSNKHKSDILKKIADELELGDCEDYHYHSDSDFDVNVDSQQLQAALDGLEKDSFDFEQNSNLDHAAH